MQLQNRAQRVQVPDKVAAEDSSDESEAPAGDRDEAEREQF